MTALQKLNATVALAALFVLVPWSASVGQEKKAPPLPKGITWNLQALDQAPLKVIATYYNPKIKSVSWVLELVRDLDVYEDGAYWAPAQKLGRTRFRFELHDENGIIMKTIDARYFGEYVTKAGKRFGAVLDLPPDLFEQIKTVEALAK